MTVNPSLLPLALLARLLRRAWHTGWTLAGPNPRTRGGNLTTGDDR